MDANWLSAGAFRDACRALPLVSIDFFVTRETDAGIAILLGLRNNAPARGFWFTPGGRIRKNEVFANAIARIALDELGVSINGRDRLAPLGVWDHFYDDSAYDHFVTTHYVNLPYHWHLSADEAESIQPPVGENEQHAAWRWQTLTPARQDREVHKYVRQVLDQLSAL